MLEILVGYSSLDATAICTLAVKDGAVQDFALVNHQDEHPETLIHRGVEAGARMLRPFEGEDEVRIVTPSVGCTDDIREVIASSQYTPDEATLVDTPPETPSSLARWFVKGNHRGALVEDIEEPVTFYTDASVQSGKKHTGGIYAVDETNRIVFFGNRTFDDVESVAEAELQAGLAGLLAVSAADVKNAVWVSDNHDAQDIVRHKQAPSSEALGIVRHCTEDFDNLKITDISGTRNILAHSLAADARHESIANNTLYVAPPLRSVESNLRAAYLQTWPYNGKK